MNRFTDLSSLSVRDLLFDPGTDVHRAIAGVVGHLAAANGELGALVAQPRVSAEVVFSAVAQAVAATLNRSGPDLAVGALVTVRDLVDAGRATLRAPDLTSVIPLGSQRLSHRATQTVQVSAGPLSARLVCRLDVDVDLEPVNATVARGRLVQLGDARCHVSSSLSIADRPVVSGKR
jgi:hypothetical protein